VPTGDSTRGTSGAISPVTLQQRPVPLRSGLGRSYTDPGVNRYADGAQQR
jgi:hypothetical protein